MKGIILAGGNGTRLYPLTKVVSKQMLPVYDKPMIYYPLTTLMEIGIRDIMIISTKRDLQIFKKLLGDGNKWGLHLKYKEQPSPDGLPQAFILAEEFIGEESVVLVLGDNIFCGRGLKSIFQRTIKIKEGALALAYPVKDPRRFGIVELDDNGCPVSIEEKPDSPRSNLAIPGIYFCDRHVVEYAKSLKPSPRGELEITDLLCKYLEQGSLKIIKMGKSTKWLDAGTPDSLLQASLYIKKKEKQGNIKIGCPEEIAYQKGWTTRAELKQILENDRPSYYKLLSNMLDFEIN